MQGIVKICKFSYFLLKFYSTCIFLNFSSILIFLGYLLNQIRINLHKIPDLDLLLLRLQKKKISLKDIYKIFSLVKFQLPQLLTILLEDVEDLNPSKKNEIKTVLHL